MNNSDGMIHPGDPAHCRICEQEATITGLTLEVERLTALLMNLSDTQKERDIYKAALENAWRRGYTSADTREALEQGKKIREGK